MAILYIEDSAELLCNRYFTVDIAITFASNPRISPMILPPVSIGLAAYVSERMQRHAYNNNSSEEVETDHFLMIIKPENIPSNESLETIFTRLFTTLNWLYCTCYGYTIAFKCAVDAGGNGIVYCGAAKIPSDEEPNDRRELKAERVHNLLRGFLNDLETRAKVLSQNNSSM